MDCWISFADPEAGMCLGVVIISDVPAPRDAGEQWTDAERMVFMKEALSRAWEMGINPGGEVLGGPYSGPGPRNYLMTPEESLEYGRQATKQEVTNATLGV